MVTHMTRRSLCAFALMLCLPCVAHAAQGGSIGLGPALILVRDVPVGQPFSLGEVAGVRYRLENKTEEEVTYNIEATVPATYGFQEFEKGYEPPPDGSWFHLDQKTLTLAPGETKHVDLTIDIPDRLEFHNRHWIIFIDAFPPVAQGIGSALKLRARLMFETQASNTVGDHEARMGEIALTPSVVAMEEKDATWTGSTHLRNNAARTAEFDILRLGDLYADKPANGDRYFPDQRTKIVEPWAMAAADSFSLKAGESRDLSLAAKAAAHDVPAGKGVDEVLFIARRAAEGAEAGTVEFKGRHYDRMELLRMHYEVPAVEGMQPVK